MPDELNYQVERIAEAVNWICLDLIDSVRKHIPYRLDDPLMPANTAISPAMLDDNFLASATTGWNFTSQRSPNIHISSAIAL